MALAALGIKKGDEVITQCFTFVATVESVLEAGAVPVLTEVDNSLNMDPQDLEAKITDKTRAIMPVHMLGSPGAHGRDHGHRPKEKNPRSGGLLPGLRFGLQRQKDRNHGGLGTYSFDYVKTLTTGEGGMVVTDDKKLYDLPAITMTTAMSTTRKFPGERILTASPDSTIG